MVLFVFISVSGIECKTGRLVGPTEVEKTRFVSNNSHCVTVAYKYTVQILK